MSSPLVLDISSPAQLSTTISMPVATYPGLSKFMSGRDDLESTLISLTRLFWNSML